jgi:hypothetical protein
MARFLGIALVFLLFAGCGSSRSTENTVIAENYLLTNLNAVPDESRGIGYFRAADPALSAFLGKRWPRWCKDGRYWGVGCATGITEIDGAKALEFDGRPMVAHLLNSDDSEVLRIIYDSGAIGWKANKVLVADKSLIEVDRDGSKILYQFLGNRWQIVVAPNGTYQPRSR